MDITDYYKNFTDMKNLMREMVGNKHGCYNSNGLVDIICREKQEIAANPTREETKEYLEAAQKRMIAMHFIMNSDMKRNCDLVDDYGREYLSGNNKYPDTLHDAYLLLKNWGRKKPGRAKVPGKLGLTTFNTPGEGE